MLHLQNTVSLQVLYAITNAILTHFLRGKI